MSYIQQNNTSSSTGNILLPQLPISQETATCPQNTKTPLPATPKVEVGNLTEISAYKSSNTITGFSQHIPYHRIATATSSWYSRQCNPIESLGEKPTTHLTQPPSPKLPDNLGFHRIVSFLTCLEQYYQVNQYLRMLLPGHNQQSDNYHDHPHQFLLQNTILLHSSIYHWKH